MTQYSTEEAAVLTQPELLEIAKAIRELTQGDSRPRGIEGLALALGEPTVVGGSVAAAIGGLAESIDRVAVALERIANAWAPQSPAQDELDRKTVEASRRTRVSDPDDPA